MKKFKVLVVDDSALMRKIISDMINSENNMEVVAIARNGQDFIKKLEDVKPNVVTLDVEMPVMNGIEALKELRTRNIGIPVIILSSVSKKSSELTMECLENGAFDFIAKPSGAISLDIDKVRNELISKLNLAYEKCQNGCTIEEIRAISKDISKELNEENKSIPKKKFVNKISALVIGASTGGPKALHQVISNLPDDLGVPVFVVQHMPATFTKAFAERLNSRSKITVVEAYDGQAVTNNVVYIAPGGFHMEVGKDKKIHLNKEPTVWGVRPAVDKLFKSAAAVYKERLMSVVLTGMGRDGAEGTIEVKKNGGITISEDQSTSVIYGMPKAAYETGMVDMVLTLDKVASEIVKIVKWNGR
ncbi:chemotaxis response regulator protein-glutamate methylesterase [Clostridium sp. HMP27]|uniref:protein-glutamate methylesterase/protein-glutamine glutaminase n=1 Tax=Clostridium sp. HMP27 TaxID=1487921 RepID=UPI00052C345D|nr:chemotaxis response regulator protein-glutamate methylesterase [Clostridium sp. HMP27]KGK86042.1 chemotaxis protein CheY [Clostridium sp. HMP27]